MSKATSKVESYEDQGFDLKDVGKRLSKQKRDRAHSQNDTEFEFEYNRYSSSPVKFVQRNSSPKGSPKLEAKKNEEGNQIMQLHETTTSSDDESEDEEQKSPPIKRTMSLPRIKMLENQQNLPKIKEEEDEEQDKVGITAAESGSVNIQTSPIPSAGDKKFTPIKVTRQKSVDIEESKLKDSPYDEDFFYYFETYLDEAIKKIQNACQKLVIGRARSKSEV